MGGRSALVVASHDYADAELQRLPAATGDAEALADVLRNPEIGGFEVTTVVDQPAHLIDVAVEQFFADRSTDDLLVLHMSCHGVKDETGDLFFAAVDTQMGLLGATAVSSEFVNRCMNRTRSRSVVLLLDCCFAGAFERGLLAKSGSGLQLEERLTGRGRAVITSSTAMEYSFVDNQLADPHEIQQSVFTRALVEGLRTGDADRDLDGRISLTELYEYVYDAVRLVTPNQTPSKWELGFQGELYVASRPGPVQTPADLPTELARALENPLAGVRVGAVQELEGLLHGAHPGLALAARVALERMTLDDSGRVRSAAQGALADDSGSVVPAPKPPELAVSTDLVDFGAVRPGVDAPWRTVHLLNRGGGDLAPRVETSDEWLRLSHTGDQVQVSLDTSTAGPRSGRITVDSAGGSATIEVRATVEPAPPPPPPKSWLARHHLDRPLVLSGVGAAVVVLAVAGWLLRPGGGGNTVTALPDSAIVLSERNDDLHADILAVDVDSGERRELLAEPVEEILATVSPDRRTVAFLAAEPGQLNQPALMSVETGDRHWLFRNADSPCEETSRVAWSEDGQRLAMTCTDAEGNVSLLVVGLDGQTITEYVPSSGELTDAPTWAQGETVIFAQTPFGGGATTLWSVDVSDPAAGARQRTFDGPDSHPDWSAEGGLLFLRGHGPGDVWVQDSSESVAQLTDSGDVRAPTWSPSGDRITFLSSREGVENGLWVLDVETGDTELVDDLQGRLGPPAWGSR